MGNVFALSKKKNKEKLKKSEYFLSGVFFIINIALLTFLILKCLVIDKFQPLALSSLSNVFLIIGIIFISVTAFLLVFTDKNARKSISYLVMAFLVMIAGILWANLQPYQKYSNISENEVTVFLNGEGGYTTFRIPSLITMDKNSLNAQGFSFDNDVLLASAEGRKSSSKDTGEIDLVYKLSFDNGENWTDLKTLISVQGEVGKIGNPTPFFDKENGTLNMVYMEGLASENYSYKTYFVIGKLLDNNSFSFDTPLLLNDSISGFDSENSLMAGPGKSIKLDSGRILIPCSSNDSSFVVFSDDNGKTWTKGDSAGSGNECEVGMLKNGTLVMISRISKPVDTPHLSQYLRFAYSTDNGETFSEKLTESDLKTPICMSSLAVKNDGTLLVTYPNDFNTRADLSVSYSKDNGKTFETKLLYDGASGYSSVTTNSNDEIFVLAEVGKVNYNEEIVLLKPVI